MKQVSVSDRLAARLPQIVLILCLIQPCLDVVSFWLTQAGFANTITLLLRLALLGGMVLLGFLLSQRRRYYYLLAGVLLLYTAAHALACIRKGYQDPVSDLTNLIRIYQLPLTTLAFITYLRREPKCLAAIQRSFFLCLLLIAAVEVVSAVTNTNPYTYPNKSVGLLGWFYFANSQSAILSVLVPVAIVYSAEKSRCSPIVVFLISFLSLGMLYFFATRLAFAALLSTGAGLVLTFLILKRTQKLLPSGRSRPGTVPVPGAGLLRPVPHGQKFPHGGGKSDFEASGY